MAARTEIEKKGFANLVLGLPYKFTGDAPEWKKLLDRVEPELKRGHVPARGLLLEVASGTGQHAAFCSAGLSGWQWQPGWALKWAAERPS